MVELIKIAALGAVNESKPASIVFGTVVNVTPLKINIEQRLTLNDAQLILTSSVKDYDVDMTMEHSTERTNEHAHAYAGKKTFRVHNGLALGEQVIMIQMQGGQKYIVLDKVVNI
ncbi:MAG TPA: DUF2577 domain-containing protein [Ruminiclostridium sp.]|nr:DUF2577 domain-containing protein [Ruminiclostridium sp.]